MLTEEEDLILTYTWAIKGLLWARALGRAFRAYVATLFAVFSAVIWLVVGAFFLILAAGPAIFLVALMVQSILSRP